MKRHLKVLLVEDSPEDAKLILRELKRGGYEIMHTVVANGDEMRTALGQQSWDLVLADYVLPRFSGSAALQILRQLDCEVPFIYVSGEIGEETAVAAMRSGAQDYVMKDRLARLAPVVERELRDAAVRRDARRSDIAMRESEHKYRHLFESLSDAAFLLEAASGRIIDTNAQAEALLHRPRHEIVGMHHSQLYPTPSSRAPWADAPAESRNGTRGDCEAEVLRKDGTIVPVNVSRSTVELHGRPFILALFRDVAERKRAEESLQNVLRHARTIIMHSIVTAPDGWDQHGPTWRVTDYVWQARFPDESAAQAVMPLDLSPGEDYYSGWVRAKHPADAMPMSLTAVGAFVSGASSWHQEFRATDRHGRLHWFDQVASIKSASHGRWQVVTINTDITERKAAEEAVVAREREFRSLAEHTPDFIVRWDRGLRRRYVNPAFASMIGVPAEQLIGQPFGTEYPKVTYAGDQGSIHVIGETIRHVFATGLATQRELPWATSSGPHVFQIRFVPEFEPEGVVSTVLGIGRDITVLKEAERQILTLTENSPDIIMRFDRESRYLYANNAVEKVTTFPASKLLGTRLGEMMMRRPGTPAEEFLALRRLNEEVFATGVAKEIEAELTLLTGPHVFNVRLIPECDDAGKVVTVLSIARDITERKQAETALRESEQRFRQVTENIDEVFWLTDVTKNAMIYISPAYPRIWGRTCESLYATPGSWLDAVHSEDRERVGAALALQAVGSYDLEYRIVCPDGTVRWIHDRAFPIANAEGQPYRIAGVAEDITARRQLEEQFRQAQKLEAVGQLASGIAHDFNNLLTVIQMQTSLLLLDARGYPGLDSGIQQIMYASKRAADLTRQLLTFSRRDMKEAKDVDISEVIGTMIKLVRRILGEDISLETRFSPGLPWVHADPGMLEQVLMNLLVNARDAMPRGGRLILSLDSVMIDADYVATQASAKAGRHVCLAVSDTGCGIAPEIRPRIFEPFFTTKEVGKGTGLGLATVFGIVQQHHGWIELESEVGRGTTFRIFLPALQKSARQLSVNDSTPAVAGGHESILLVEDETAVRTVSSAALRRNGYHVVEARTAAEVLERWATLDGKIDLLVTDIVMPGGVSGQKLAKELQKRRPGLKVIFTTGYSGQIVRRQLKLEAGRNYLPKPYSFVDLTTIVRRRLDDA